MDFDLNINNYSVEELEELLTLGHNYRTEDVGYKKDKLCTKIMNDSTLSFDMKAKIGDFFENASKTLCKVIRSSKKNSHKGDDDDDDDDDKDDKDDNAQNFKDLKNTMMRNTNNLIISDPYSAHNKVPTKAGKSINSYGADRGVINPISTNTILKGVSIDSRFRENYYTTKSTELSITLPFRLENVVSYRVVGITLPLSFYNISQAYGNNVIRIVVYSNATPPVPYEYDLILPDGCYNSTEIAVYSSSIEVVINNLLINDPNSLNNQSPFNGSTTLLGLRYIVDRTSGRSIFAQDTSILGTVPYHFEIITNVGLNITTNTVKESFDRTLMLRLGWVLGYRAAKYSSSNPTTSPSTYGSIVSEGICFTKFPLYGYLSIDDFNKNSNDYFVSVFANSISVPNIISRVNFTQFFQSVGAFQAAQGESTSNSINREKRFFGPVTIKKLKITIYDDLGRVLDLNNMDWALELSFECVYSM
jgi:hypothetical protein